MRLLAALAILPILGMAQQRGSTNYVGTTPSERFVVDQTQALTIIQACAAAAVKYDSPSDIAVVDPAGLLVAFLRTDNAYIGSIDISQKKAKTVAYFNGAMTTAQWYPLVQPGASLYGIEETNGGLIAFGGGVPLFLNGKFIGAVGVSGGTTGQDIDIALAGVLAIGATTGNDTIVPTK